MIKRNIKKGVALLTAVSMLSGLSLSAVDYTRVHADTTSSEPSLCMYASKEDMMTKFNPTSSNATIGKIKLGTNNGDNQEWYILGSDSGVDDDNTAIFATDNMTEAMIFQPGYRLKRYTYNNKSYASFFYKGNRKIEDLEITYKGTLSPSSFFVTHYGLSDARILLRKIVEDKYDNFSIKELELMNKTKVNNDDFYNRDGENPSYYITNDKLYLPYSDRTKNEIGIGSDDSKSLPRNKYWNSGDAFWLRLPYYGDTYSRNRGVYANPGQDNTPNMAIVYEESFGLRPASNLNLIDVLFASAVAPALNTDYTANILDDDIAMTLRLNGSSGKIGKATIVDKNTLEIERGSTTEPVYLVIQGKNPLTGVDWYWSKEISDNTETISGVEYWKVSQQVMEGFETSWNLSDCKIWLESSLDSDADTISYAVEATESSEPEECEHDYKLVEATKPTRTEPGYKEHWECTKCGKWFVFIVGQYVEITKEALTIPAIGKKSSGSSGSSSNISTGWIKEGKGWRYRNSDGILAQGSTVKDLDGNNVEKVLWQKAGNGYYAFGSDGYLITGWIYDRLADKWYYCDENLGKLYGWFKEAQDGYWYYLSPSTGEVLTGWHTINGKDYYFAGTPSAPTYSFDASTDTWIYSNINGVRPFGSMYANTITPDNYQVDANGAWIR